MTEMSNDRHSLYYWPLEPEGTELEGESIEELEEALSVQTLYGACIRLGFLVSGTARK